MAFLNTLEKDKNISVLEIKIKKWIRHQIRVHLKSIWYPILWDKLYNKSKKDKTDILNLWSVWFDIVW